jgi:Methyltransferase domain
MRRSPMKFTPEELDRARRHWLEGLRQAHRAAPTAETALQQARAEWMCGEYDASMALFIEARDRAPDVPWHHLAAARTASMLNLRDLEDSALEQGRLRFPSDPGLALHAAMRLVPDDFEQAHALLAPHASDPVHRLYASALRVLADGRAPASRQFGDARLDARWASFLWMSRKARPEAFAGFSNDALARALAGAPAAGTTLECGVYFGRSLRIIAAATRGPVHGFDSFEGLPEAWHAGEPAGAYSTGGRRPSMPPNVTLHPGWFDQTMPAFFAAHPSPVRLLHVDCDIYASTRTVLTCAAKHLVVGSVVVFDDLLGYPGFEEHELRAFHEHASDHDVSWEVVAGVLLGREVAIRITE